MISGAVNSHLGILQTKRDGRKGDYFDIVKNISENNELCWPHAKKNPPMLHTAQSHLIVRWAAA